jgi:hypothetical protein
MGRAKGTVWMFVGKQPLKTTETDKSKILSAVSLAIARTTKIKNLTSRIAIRAGRVYIYRLFEPTPTEGVTFTEPLTDGRYFEIPLARITIHDRACKDCTLDFQRYNNQWMTIDEGTLEECINKAEDSEWFE